jgi:transcriptional regulator with XRE-family HTH domain
VEPSRAFGQLIKPRRKAGGISQEALADRAGLHRTEVSLVERGERNACLDTITLLALGLETTPSDLLADLDLSALQPRKRPMRRRIGA